METIGGKELEKLPGEAIARIVTSVERLTANPFPAGFRKLVASERTYRIRVGSYRVIYTVQSSVLLIEIIKWVTGKKCTIGRTRALGAW